MNLFIRRIYTALASLLILTNSATIQAQSSLKAQITEHLLSDLTQLYPDALNINIDFNLPKTQKKYASCKKIDIPTLQKVTPGGRITLRLSCNSPRWSTYITVKTAIYYPIVTAFQPIRKGELLSIDNTRVQKRDVTATHQRHYTDPSTVMGMQARRSIKANAIITANMLDTPLAVRKDDSVLILAGRAGLSISTVGTALQSGKPGRQIRVKNNRSGRIIRAYVLSPGRVTTNPP